ncbi:MAG: preprotein translocase subunit SecA [Coriobacteriia bacterium]|nr:preprotein translocase subunit SecA [Coriobacteriia bacterium]MCL2537391.1 preprotein translocase subunit SecA [Coriobacteriia bacterium]
MAKLLASIFSIGEGKALSEYEKKIKKINELESKYEALSDEDFPIVTEELKQRVRDGETLDDVMLEAFAAVREGSKRALGMRHYDVQLIGAMVLHDGKIAEMKTGEGKTLVATAAVYLEALAEKGVHVVTVNDYLASRDAEWMGRLYKFMGLEVGCIVAQMPPDERRPAYDADVTYGTNSEFGFDYLRDNMATRSQDRVQRGHNFAIVDEVDSILIDEARTPLIISGAGAKSASTYKDFAKAVAKLENEKDFDLDEAKRTCAPTESGISKVERMLSIDDIYMDPSGAAVNHLQQALKAEFLFKRDVDYMVQDGEVLIVDEFTGRPMVGRRYSDGLHQAIEAKERVSIREENQTLATITLQNYFRMYDKLSGMTGTAVTEDKEFREIYKLPVMVIPTNMPMVREDRIDLVYRNVETKYNAVADLVAECHKKGQPVLLGTISIEHSEYLSFLLKKRGIKHNILNAKYHDKEALIIAQAGSLGAVTIATNMAGRGTDILLGGNPEGLVGEYLIKAGVDPLEATDEERDSALKAARAQCEEEKRQVIEAGGLAVIGTERHEARRIDNQLRGRAGRQGDPGMSQFYLSLEDDLMRLFGGDKMDRIAGMMESADVPDDMPISAKLVAKAVESSQRKVELMNFASRKHVLEYDDVMNKQREVIYAERSKVLDGKDIHDQVLFATDKLIGLGVKEYCGDDKSDAATWDVDGLTRWFQDFTGMRAGDTRNAITDTKKSSECVQILTDAAHAKFKEKEDLLGPDNVRDLERQVMLRILDTRWMSHLEEMDYLKEGIGMRAMGQRDPKVEYKNDAYEMFIGLVQAIDEDFVKTLMHINVVVQPQDQGPGFLQGASYSAPEEAGGTGGVMTQAAAAATSGMGPSSGDIQAAASAAGGGKVKTVRKDKEDPFATVGRNDPCPCGSGLKYKKCHGLNS